MFDHQYFVGWFQRLLDEMSAAGLKNTIIRMDSAKYHKGKPIDTPKYNNRKADLVEACRNYSIDISATDTKPVIWKKLKVYLQANVLPVVVEMAHKAGHEVIYTPPHHPSTDRASVSDGQGLCRAPVQYPHNVQGCARAPRARFRTGQLVDNARLYPEDGGAVAQVQPIHYRDRRRLGRQLERPTQRWHR